MPPFWYRYTSKHNDWVGFSEINIQQTSEYSVTPIFIRDIIVESTMKIHCNVLGKRYDMEKNSIFKQHIEYIEDLSNVIHSISKFKVCKGLKSWQVKKYFSVASSVSTNVLNVDSLGTYRHSNCQFLLYMGNKCINCARALKTIGQTVKRISVNSPKRLKVIVTPTKRTVLDRLRKKSEVIKKKNKRQENKIKILQNDLSESVKKMKTVEINDITDKLVTNNVPQYQQVIIQEIIGATKVW